MLQNNILDLLVRRLMICELSYCQDSLSAQSWWGRDAQALTAVSVLLTFRLCLYPLFVMVIRDGTVMQLVLLAVFRCAGQIPTVFPQWHET